MKKIICLILAIVILSGTVTNVFAAEKEKMVTIYYERDGGKREVPESDKDIYLSNGWTLTPVIPVYSAEGKTKYIKETEKDKYFKEGWFDSPVITVYAMDGRTTKIPSSKKDAYLKVGWYDSPIITVYAMDGRTTKIPSSKKEAYLKVGWYDSPIITMYAEDGRTKKIPTSQKEAYKKVGWYYGPVTTIYAGDGRSKKIGANEKADYLKVGWYEVPMVTVGTLDGRSKVIKKKDLEAYKKVGWYHIPYVKVETQKVKDGVYEITNRTKVEDYGFRSEMQQFKYKNEGLAYAVMMYHTVYIVLPSKVLSVKVDCSFRNPNLPSLGDVISDDDGNIYVIWGQGNNDTKNKDVNTIFISKYSPSGEHLKTVSFKGEGYLGINGRTQYPFAYGNCDSEIADGKLVVNYAREMYNGHQSNNVIGVKLADMTPLKFEGINTAPYVSHAFNQRVIWSKLTNSFVYANHGDGGSTRGFVISYKARNWNTFHFYMQANARGSLAVLNKTFAQMGSLVETSKGIVLVGASAKSIGLNTPNEKQNLFIQIIKPNVWELGPDFFVGGSKRSGASAYSHKDTKNSPLTPVTDYGVQWFTNYTSKDVIAPHAVVVKDKIVILWNTQGEKEFKSVANYAVLANNGKVIVPPSVLGKDIPLNSMEDPIYHNGKIWWVGNNQVVNITIQGL